MVETGKSLGAARTGKHGNSIRSAITGQYVVKGPRGGEFEIRIVGRGVSSYKKSLLGEIAAELLTVPEEQLRANDTETAAEAAHRFIASRRTGNEWDEAIGPFYETAPLVKWLGMSSRQSLKNAVDRGEILAVKAGRTLLYPTFQFDTSGQPLPGLPRVLEALRGHLSSPWDQALWLKSPIDDVEGAPTVADHLRAGHVDQVARMAAEDVARWAA